MDMFESLTSKLEKIFDKITGRGVLDESDISAAMKEVRLALLEADVNYKIVKDFCKKVSEKALGTEVLKSLSPGQQVIKIVHEELTSLMGSISAPLDLKAAPPVALMLVGLQGSGKTTTAAKLAHYISKELKRRPLLVPADVYRPAAIEQLTLLGQQINIDVYEPHELEPVFIAKDSITYAANKGFDTIIIDTAGRLHIDTELMQELKQIKTAIAPHEILLVANAMTGQEAVNVAEGFDSALDLTGIILTKFDGDARGGAALSMKAITNKPIKFIGIGEKNEDLEVFHPQRIASRILGMGDVLTLIEKASKEVDIEKGVKLQKKLQKNQFDLEDFLEQLKMMRKMGDMSSILGMIPGAGKLMKQVNSEDMEKELRKTEAIILSMTRKERTNHAIINGSRRRRIAKGSGTTVQDVNRLLKQFTEMKKMMKKLSKFGLGKAMGGLMKFPLGKRF